MGTTAQVTFNKRGLKLEIEKIVGEVMLPKARLIAEEIFTTAKQELIISIKKSDVARELKPGRNLKTSDFIIAERPVSLYGFLGFEAGTDPIRDLIDLIEQNYILNKNAKLVNGDFVFNVKYANVNDLKRETPLPWGRGTSWISAIEKDFGGLGHYLFLKGLGRSDKGVQTKVDRGGELVPQKFITDKLNKFRKSIRAGG